MRNNRYLYITLLAVLSLHAETLQAQTASVPAQPVQEKIKYAPRLVVAITIDELRTDYLDAFSPLYGNEGFKRLLREGLVYENGSYAFSQPDRASAISSLVTGTSPYYHSIVAERWLDRETLRPTRCTDDNRQPGLLSPVQLGVSTLGDELKVSTEGASKVFTIAPTQEAAILSAGHAADGAFWLDDSNGQWKTSQYYLNSLPAWILSFNELHSAKSHISKTLWEPVIPLSGTFNYYQHIGGQKPFRHAFKGERKFISYKASGLINEELTKLALELVTNQTMGYDRITDLLCLTYYAGTFDHSAMTDCQLELQDTYVRLDRELARLTKDLEKRLGAEHVLFVLTSTGYSAPESAQYDKYRIPTGTFYINRTANLLNMYYGAIWGQGRYVENCFGNQLFLNHKLLESKRISLTDATRRAQEFISQIAGVRNVYTGLQLLSDNNQLLSKIRNAYNPSHCGDILIEVAPGWKLFNEDTKEEQLQRTSFIPFPIIFFGAGTEARRVKTPVTTERIAPTLARTMRIRAPNACSSEPLF